MSDKASGGRVECGKPYIIGDHQDYWLPLPKEPLIIECEATDEQIEAVAEMIRKAIKRKGKRKNDDEGRNAETAE